MKNIFRSGDWTSKTLKNILLGIIFAPIIGFTTYYYVPPIYDLANSIWTGTLPVVRGGTGTTTSTGTGNTVLSASPTFTGTISFPGSGQINSSGQVGIGGSALNNFSGDFLDVQGTFNSPLAALVRNTNTGSSALACSMINASGNSWGMCMGSTANNSNRLSFYLDVLGGGAFSEKFGVDTSGRMQVGYTSSQAGNETLQVNGSLAINSNTLAHTYTSFSDGAAANVGTLTNAPAAGNPTKWISINDNGTTRYIPAW